MVGKWGSVLQSANTDIVDGSIFQLIFWFSVSLLVGNFFQQLYNAVDSCMVGNFVNTNALAVIRALTPVINTLVGFFMGLSTGVGVVIPQYFGARQDEAMSRVVHSAMAPTGLLSIVFTGPGLLYTRPLLKAIGVPEDVLSRSSLYLVICFCGITFLFFYNMGSGTPRTVGDSRYPLLYLAVASTVSIILDFTFMYGFHIDVVSVAIVTVMAQAVSSLMTMHKLIHTCEDYKVGIRKIRFRKKMIRKITASGFPAACQQSITSLSSVVAQSCINRFGTAAMTGYSATLRIDGFLQLPLQSFNMVIITFVGQNIGAREYRRVKKRIFAAWVISPLTILANSVGMYSRAPLLTSVFTNDLQVTRNKSSVFRIFSRVYIVMSVIQVLNGALRGARPSKVSTFFMLGSFVVLRQIYLLVAVPMTHSLMVVMAERPITWVICAAGMFPYYVRTDWLPEEVGPEEE